MLIIRKEQVAALAEAVRRNYEERLVRHVERFFPARFESLGKSGVRELVRRGIRLAAKYGIDTESGAAIFTELMAEFGEAFEQTLSHEPLREILEHPTLPAEAKAQLLYVRFTGRRQEA